jgi:hypothetical protein
MIAIKGKWNVWRRQGDRVTIYTAWGERPIQRLELDPIDTAMWDAMDGEIRLNELRAKHDPKRLAALVHRLTHSDVQALKLSAFPLSMYAKRPSLTPSYLISTMPYPAWAPGQPLEAAPKDVDTEAYYQQVGDADAQFEHTETTLSHLFRVPHPALAGRTYGAALVDGLAATKRLPSRAIRVLEIGGGLGYVARAVCEALAARGARGHVHDPGDVAAPRRGPARPDRRAAGHRGRRRRPRRRAPGRRLRSDPVQRDGRRPARGPALAGRRRPDHRRRRRRRRRHGRRPRAPRRAGPDPWASASRTPPSRSTCSPGAFELVIRIARWLAPEGTAVVTEFGERAMWPKLSSHLDHPELSTHFGHLQQAAIASGLEAKIDFVMDLIDLDRSLEGLATTRSHFRALQAVCADAGVTLPKLGYTRDLLAATVGDKLDLSTIGELRWDRIEDRLMGLVPHEFKALVCRKPGGN